MNQTPITMTIATPIIIFLCFFISSITFFILRPPCKVIHIYRILAIHFLFFFSFLQWTIVWCEHTTQCVHDAREVGRSVIVLHGLLSVHGFHVFGYGVIHLLLGLVWWLLVRVWVWTTRRKSYEDQY